jgi:hypothetical protein
MHPQDAAMSYRRMCPPAGYPPGYGAWVAGYRACSRRCHRRARCDGRATGRRCVGRTTAPTITTQSVATSLRIIRPSPAKDPPTNPTPIGSLGIWGVGRIGTGNRRKPLDTASSEDGHPPKGVRKLRRASGEWDRRIGGIQDMASELASMVGWTSPSSGGRSRWWVITCDVTK